MQHKKFLFMARGSSHIRYFKELVKNLTLPIKVIQINKKWIHSSDFQHWHIVSGIDINQYLESHFLKKQKKFSTLSQTPVWSLYKMLCKIYVKLEIVKCCGLISRSDASTVGVWNGQKLPSSSIELAAKALGKDVVYFENGLLPNTTVCDWNGVNCLNSMPKNPEFYLDYLDIQSILPTQLTHHQSAKKSSDEEDKSTLPERYLFVPFQIETDSQIIRNSPWIQSMEQLWEVLCRVIDQCEDTELQIVIKEHPLEKKRYKHLHNKHERILFFNNTTTQSLIENSTAVLTINSTVGIESLLLKKQLLVLGKACYRLTGLSSGISNENQLNNTINRLTELQCDEKLRQGFLNFLHTYYAIPEYWNKAKAKHFIALERRLTKQDHLGKVLSQTYCADKNIQAA